MSKLEKRVKQDLAMQSLLKTQTTNAELREQAIQEEDQSNPAPQAQKAK
jgi:hypothetical protein